ncbi:ATP-dependent DNA helicase UvrD/PcrA [hydrothermal vent metagenome]|uniref:DNA 3'-5' helicase n=1 Tax=hydrothermal vent metagenome TaxID=652676 RepID=A0A3B1CZD5_9ZZZZ
MSQALQHPILSQLNPEQRAAAGQIDGPLLILAGAGSGKTRVIVHRIAYLVEALDVSPFRILAVTFTNKASKEMRERVSRLLAPEIARKLMISTFHSACLRILRQHVKVLGLQKDFVVYDASDQLVLMKSCIADLEINEDLFPPRSLLSQIGKLKHQLVSAEAYANRAGEFGFEAALKKVYSLYQERLGILKALDFDDLIGCTIRLFQENPQVLASYQDRFQYIMVDEYQDTNHAQYQLICLLSAKHRNLCVVGDDDQSIYAFRGADVGNILSFERDFADTKVVILNQNYRSTSTILTAATAMIEKNTRRKQKNLWTENGVGEKIVWAQVPDEKAEARFILKNIRVLREREGTALSNFAILYRTNAQSRVIEEALRTAGVPYFIYGGQRFYDRKEVKDLMAYLRLLIYPDDDISLRRIINLPTRGIGRVTLERLALFAEDAQMPLLQALQHLDEAGLSPQGKRGLSVFFELIVRLQSFAENAPLPELIRYLIEEISYLDYLKKSFGPESESRIENVLELIAAADQFVLQIPEAGLEWEEDEDLSDESETRGLKGFLDQVALVSSGDENEVTEKRVTLMTLHSAKGLEFPVVFMAGMEDGLFPHTRSLNESKEMEEERRLCYVGMTRAKERLYLISAAQRRLYGTSHWNNPSRFIRDLPEEGVRIVKEAAVPGGYSGPSYAGNHAAGNVGAYAQNRYASPTPSPTRVLRKKESGGGSGQIEAGDMVRHSRFGIGRVKHYEGAGVARKVTVLFETYGMKKMILKYANLELY